MGTVALRVSDAGKRYERDGQAPPVFMGINLAVEDGEIYVLLGPSGCGKSTLLRAIAGLEPLTTGQIAIDGADPRRRHGHGAVGIVFQEPLLLPWLTVAENVALGLHYRANQAARRPEAVETVLRDLGLAALADAYPGELSGGQAQRVSLARTIVTQPRLVLLDEPFSALDPATRAALQSWLLELARRRRLTLVLVTHDVDEALTLGDHIGLMSRRPGTITASWTTRGPSQSPAETARLRPLREEILAHYQVDLPTDPTEPSWVI